MPQEKQKKNKRITNLLLVFFALIFVGSAGFLLWETVFVPMQNDKATDEYRDLYNSAPESSPTESKPILFENVLDKFQPLLNINPDTAGWLTIGDTSLDNPVFYRPDDVQYYLKRTPDGEYNKLGSLFLGYGTSLNPQSKVLVMYGHNMEDNDELFGQLTKFKKLNFMKEHRTFTFDTIYREGTWKIISVVRASTNDNDKHLYPYWNTEYSSQEEFDAFLKETRLRSIYQIEDDATYADDFLVMSTCDYVFWGDRLVIVARRLRDGETAESVQDDEIVVNSQVKYSDNYYEIVGGSCPDQDTLEENYRNFYEN